MHRVPTGHTGKHCLAAPVVSIVVTASRARLNGVPRRHLDDPVTAPVLLVTHLAVELAPALIEDCLVQCGFLPGVRTPPVMAALDGIAHSAEG